MRLAILAEEVGPLLAELGQLGEVEHCPLTQTVPLLASPAPPLAWLRSAPGAALVALTSRRTPRYLDSAFAAFPAACVGPSTAAAARQAGFQVALVSAGAAEELAGGIAGAFSPGTRVLLPGSSRARDVLAERLVAAGLETRHHYLYTTTTAPGAAAAAARAARADLIVASAPSQVVAWGEVGGPAAGTWVALGRPTFEACAAAGLTATMPRHPPELAAHVASIIDGKRETP